MMFAYETAAIASHAIHDPSQPGYRFPSRKACLKELENKIAANRIGTYEGIVTEARYLDKQTIYIAAVQGPKTDWATYSCPSATIVVKSGQRIANTLPEPPRSPEK